MPVTSPSDSSTVDLCAICRDTMDPANDDPATLRWLKCAHVYHKACVDQWLTVGSNCPACRRPVAIARTEYSTRSETIDLIALEVLGEQESGLVEPSGAHAVIVTAIGCAVILFVGWLITSFGAAVMVNHHRSR